MSNLAKKTQKILPVNRVLSTSLMCFWAWHSSLYFKTFMSNRFVGKHLYFLVGHIRHFLLLFQPTFYTLFLTIWQLTPYALVKKNLFYNLLKMLFVSRPGCSFCLICPWHFLHLENSYEYSKPNSEASSLSTSSSAFLSMVICSNFCFAKLPFCDYLTACVFFIVTSWLCISHTIF